MLQICSEVDLRGPSERTPLHEATSNSVVAIARLLVSTHTHTHTHTNTHTHTHTHAHTHTACKYVRFWLDKWCCLCVRARTWRVRVSLSVCVRVRVRVRVCVCYVSAVVCLLCLLA